MNRLDRAIMKQILTEEQSAYSVNERLKKSDEKSNYATVWRHIKKMKTKNLLNVTDGIRKNGTADNRNTEILSLTNKGLATLLIEGDLQENESNTIAKKMIQKYFGKNLLGSLNSMMTQIFSGSLLKIKPRVNLKFFDEDYFDDLFLKVFFETLIETLDETEVELDKTKLQEVFSRVQKKAKKEGTEEFLQKGFDFGKNYRKLKEKGE